MAGKPKLEFCRFTLNAKDDKRRTFRDFAIEELGAKSDMSNDEIFKLNFGHFIEGFSEKHAKSSKKKKTITVINDPKKNPYLSHKPTLSISEQIVCGVINGGPYDKEAIVANVSNVDDNENLGRNQAVLLPYFIFVYLPTDHFEGFFIVHINSREDSITDIFRSYITNVFSGIHYNKALPTSFCPCNFQKEYRDGAVIKDMIFSTTVIDNSLSNDPIIGNIDGYKVEIKISNIKDKNKKKLSMNLANSLLNRLKGNSYKKDDQDINIGSFESKKMTVEREVGNKNPKTFRWNTMDNDFVPVVDIAEQGVSIIDGTPDFTQLKNYCRKLFNDEIKKEIRRDLYVTKN